MMSPIHYLPDLNGVWSVSIYWLYFEKWLHFLMNDSKCVIRFYESKQSVVWVVYGISLIWPMAHFKAILLSQQYVYTLETMQLTVYGTVSTKKWLFSTIYEWYTAWRCKYKNVFQCVLNHLRDLLLELIYFSYFHAHEFEHDFQSNFVSNCFAYFLCHVGIDLLLCTMYC